ncbi:DUF4167 domain-containing protein [Agrobacterium tumefaciens]|uniref:DUF4167 domain-containing protein n=1 Tax=Agrobacterium tumefaciens TaxID=358 RepID=UPI0015727E89|nr:DUF4167 domain-containing protein [Agrobacterium tumefaciens]
MRPGQQNKRGRGRGSNNNNNNGGGNNNNFNRKGGNPLTRTYDSSGPDVKIRGTAQHIAEKYATLARDAQSAGDRVIAENYLQHAEHYNRIIATAQAQMQERFQRDDRGEYNASDADDMDMNDGDDGAPQQQFEQPERVQQPERQERQERTERSEPRQERRERPDRRERQERQPRQPQASDERQQPVYDASQAPQPVIEGTPMEVAVEEQQQQTEAPATERAPKARRATGPRPRRPRRAATAEGAEGAEGEDTPAGDEATAATLENAAE